MTDADGTTPSDRRRSTRTNSNRSEADGANQQPLLAGAQTQSAARERQQSAARERTHTAARADQPTVQSTTDIPLGAKVISITLGLFGVVLLWAGFQVVTGPSPSTEYASTGSNSFTLVGLVMLAYGCVHLAGAYGLWTITPWGRQIAKALVWIGLVGGVLMLLQVGAPGIWGVGLYGAMAWYMHTHAIPPRQDPQNQSSRPA